MAAPKNVFFEKKRRENSTEAMMISKQATSHEIT